MKSFEQYLRESTLTRNMVDSFIDPEQNTWAQFDSVVGYILGNFIPRDGIDGSSTISTARKTGMRTPAHYTEKPCRLNTYGNSFTECHQVSDGETWQEYLAAHLGEPVRNFGMGGFGTYQAYRRLIQMEPSNLGAEYVILYIWGDDHVRSLMRCRHAVTYPKWNLQGEKMFHGNFWAHLEMDLDSGTLVEKENILPTPESLYSMTDPDFMVNALKDDLILQILVLDKVEPGSIDLKDLDRLADILNVDRIDLKSPERLKETSNRLKHAYSFCATRTIVGKTAEFCLEKGKKLMINLLCPRVTRQLLNNEPRYDQEIIDFLKIEKILFFDMNRVHEKDFKDFNLSVEDYLKRYYIGHYNPTGNHFFAFSIKDKIVDWLDPKPITYMNDKDKMIDFEGYLSE